LGIQIEPQNEIDQMIAASSDATTASETACRGA
jgi:hypothetical protein